MFVLFDINVEYKNTYNQILGCMGIPEYTRDSHGFQKTAVVAYGKPIATTLQSIEYLTILDIDKFQICLADAM
jgi:hypothetical protein